MPHSLIEANPNAPWNAPLMVTLRYQCQCHQNEVLTINMIFDRDLDEETFVWTMQQLYRDMKLEIFQHTKVKIGETVNKTEPI